MSRRRNAGNGARNSSATARTAIAKRPAAATDRDTEPVAYVGRFAPSPTGPLHLGSLAAALVSYLEARTRGGRWLLRIEDLDGARTIAGMADQHLRTLEAYGFRWDGSVSAQSADREPYLQALARLRRHGCCYECSCSRSEIAGLSPAESPEEDHHYPGLCRDGVRHPKRARAIRLRVPERVVCFHDRMQGRCCDDVACSVGDFIVCRRDGVPAYQLAVVVDDARQGVTDVVRGCDLLSSTARQILLQEALGLPRPGYAHLPLIVGVDGGKLSKSRHAIGLDRERVGPTLLALLELLGQSPPRELTGAPPNELWTWALAHWNAAALAGRRVLRAAE